MSDILIVSMPYGPLTRPSIALGLLVASSKKRGLNIKALYPTFSFASQIGFNIYTLISELSNPLDLIGEWTFSKAAFPEFDSDPDKYFNILLNRKNISKKFFNLFKIFSDNNDIKQKFLEIRDKATTFVKHLAKEIVDKKPKIVACSSIFYQNCSSLGLLREIKNLNPNIVTIMGGANCESEMGLEIVKNFRWIDYVMSGEGDITFPELCENILKGENNKLPEGVYTAQKSSTLSSSIVENLNNLPFPDYDDYFYALNKSYGKHYIIPGILVETSRGCWKGNKNPCTFCGLNGVRSQYRSKSPIRILEELEFIYRKYNIDKFFMTDTILNMNYFKNLLITLSKRKDKFNIFFETISTLNEKQVKLLADAGIYSIQPGIESLDDNILKILKKGNSAIKNIALLKFALENGIRTSWNILVAVPGDENKWYDNMKKIIPLLHHFSPPSLSPIRYDRFSIYHKNQKKYGLKLRPSATYSYIYPLSDKSLNNFAYFFVNENRDIKKSIFDLYPEIIKWQKFKHIGKKIELTIIEKKDHSIITDTRECTYFTKIILKGIDHEIYKICRSPITFKEIEENLNSNFSTNEIKISLSKLIEKKLLIYMDKKYLALANYPPKREFLNDEFMPSGCLKTFNLTYPKMIKNENKVWNWFEEIGEKTN